jgi:hypothetical protein
MDTDTGYCASLEQHYRGRGRNLRGNGLRSNGSWHAHLPLGGSPYSVNERRQSSWRRRNRQANESKIVMLGILYRSFSRVKILVISSTVACFGFGNDLLAFLAYSLKDGTLKRKLGSRVDFCMHDSNSMTLRCLLHFLRQIVGGGSCA